MVNDNEKKPMVSVCTITYNHEKYIRDCLEGIVTQKTNFPFEAIVHDDASTDKTADIIREYAEKYPDIIKPVYQTENQHSKGIRISATFIYPKVRGKYIAICEGDDYWTDPYKLQKQVDFLEANPDYYLVFGETVRRKGDDFFPFKSRWNTRKTDFDVQDYICRQIGHTSTICCRNHYKDWENYSKGWECQILQGDQQFVLFQASPHCDKIKFMDEPMSVYRDHPGGVTKTKRNMNMDNSMNSYIAILKRFNRNNNGYYEKIVAYRIREVTVLREIEKEASRFKKLLKCLRNARVIFKYLLRKYAGIRPF